MINKKLKALRAQHGMTRKDLADEVNVSKQTICAIKKRNTTDFRIVDQDL
ncbi:MULTISPECIES: helix-turn-helix transcriptional regulator [Enterococcus]|nr:helix-turn-helix domain-containing protein [Enterococcus durans]